MKRRYCAIDGCPDGGINHVAGHPDCLDLCDTHYRFVMRNEEPWDRMVRLAGCLHDAAESAPEVTPVTDSYVPVYAAQRLSDDSWLHDAAYDDFRAALAYAATQTHAIPGLAKCSPEEVWHLWAALDHGLQRAALNAPTQEDDRG